MSSNRSHMKRQELDLRIAKAINDNETEKLRNLIVDEGANPSDYLFHACESNKIQCTLLLISLGADVNVKREAPPRNMMRIDVYPTILLIAIKKREIDLIKVLIQHGADVNAVTTGSNVSPLLRAAGQGDLDIVKLLIQNGADVNSKGIAGRTPLHGVIEFHPTNCIEIMEILLKNGASVNALDNCNRSPLHVAAKIGNVKIARFLVENGCNIHITSKMEGQAIHVAALGDARNYVDVVKFLISCGANVNSSTKWGWT